MQQSMEVSETNKRRPANKRLTDSVHFFILSLTNLLTGYGSSSTPVRTRVAPVPTVCEVLAALTNLTGRSRQLHDFHGL